MIQRVYEQAKKCSALTKIIVATDDQQIFEHVKSFGGEVMMTSPDHQSGTERCAEAAEKFPDLDIIINIQGDEPFIDPKQIEQLLDILKEGAEIGTLVKKITAISDYKNPNVVKAVINTRGEAMYFSRAAVPHFREQNFGGAFKHIGMYGYQLNVLQELVKLGPTPLEQAEQLEQLRWLENGYTISAGETEIENISIDTPEDLEKIKSLRINR